MVVLRLAVREGRGEPELLVVEVWGLANSLAYVADGNFMYRGEGAVGVFRRLVPVVPETMP